MTTGHSGKHATYELPKSMEVGCKCGWRGMDYELVKRGETHQCPACSAVFSPWPK